MNILLIVVFFLISTINLSILKNNEKNALIQFFINTNGRNWRNSQNWIVNEDFCTWHGITCNENKSVEKLLLVANNLEGSNVLKLGSLKNLKEL